MRKRMFAVLSLLTLLASCGNGYHDGIIVPPASYCYLYVHAYDEELPEPVTRLPSNGRYGFYEDASRTDIDRAGIKSEKDFLARVAPDPDLSYPTSVTYCSDRHDAGTCSFYNLVFTYPDKTKTADPALEIGQVLFCKMHRYNYTYPSQMSVYEIIII